MKTDVIGDFYKEVEYPDIEEIVSSSFDEALEECFRELGVDFDFEDEYRMAEEENPLDEIFNRRAEEYFREEEEPEIDFEREDRIAERAFCKSRGIRF